MKTTKIITGLLTLLGFSATQVSCIMYGPPADEYGSPRADFELKGKVVNEAGAPIEGIEVSAKWQIYDFYPTHTTTTDSNGEYLIEDPDAWFGTTKLTITAEDVDGEENGGEFATEDSEIEVKPEDYVGGDGRWYDGKATKTANFTLTLKPQESDDE